MVELATRPAPEDLPVQAPAPSPRVAVMQPYLFPYLGTYQLAASVDVHVHFDDVAFIKKGYVHRNAVLRQGAPHAFAAPVRHASQNRTIAEHEYTGEWRGLLDLLREAYRRAPRFDEAFALVESVVLDPDENVARKNARSLERVLAHWGTGPRWAVASASALPPTLRGEQRILALCRERGAATYVNAAGGRALYEPAHFEAEGLALRFLRSLPFTYAQGPRPFVPNLSVIDVLMHCAPEEARALLSRCALEP